MRLPCPIWLRAGVLARRGLEGIVRLTVARHVPADVIMQHTTRVFCSVTHLQLFSVLMQYRFGHYDFLADCTELGHERLGKLCEVNADKQVTHQAAIQQARSLFDSMLR